MDTKRNCTEEMSPVLILSHNDLDGAVAAFCLSKVLEHRGFFAISRFVSVSLASQVAKDCVMLKDVAPYLAITDLSASLFQDSMKELITHKIPGCPLLFDHHQESLVYAEEEWTIVQENLCAASVVFDWGKEECLSDIKGLEDMVYYTNCQDLWKNPLPQKSQELNALACLYGPEGIYSMLLEKGAVSLLEDHDLGKRIVEGRKERISDLKSLLRFFLFERKKIALADFPENIHVMRADANFIAEAVLEDVDLYIRVLRRYPLWVSLRSRNGEALKFVHQIMEREKAAGNKVAGGGHPNAAGLSFSESESSLEKLLPSDMVKTLP